MIETDGKKKKTPLLVPKDDRRGKGCQMVLEDTENLAYLLGDAAGSIWPHLCVSASPGADCFCLELRGEKREVWLRGQEETLLARTTGMAGVSLATHFCQASSSPPQMFPAPILRRLMGFSAGGARQREHKTRLSPMGSSCGLRGLLFPGVPTAQVRDPTPSGHNLLHPRGDGSDLRLAIS